MIESMTRRELQKLYDLYLKPAEVKLSRKNANKEKVIEELENQEIYSTKLIHLICLKLIGSISLSKTLDEMLQYNLIFVDKEAGNFKIIDRAGSIIGRYHIDYFTNHLIFEGIDLGIITLLS